MVSSVIVKNSRVHPLFVSYLIPFMKSPFSHILENLNIPYPYKDWDEGEDTLENRRTRYKNVNSEMAFCYFINVVISLIHLVPMLLTGLAINDLILYIMIYQMCSNTLNNNVLFLVFCKKYVLMDLNACWQPHSLAHGT